MSVQYRVVSTDDGRWGLQAKDFGFWWRNVGSEVNEGVVHLTTFETAAEASAWIDRQQNPSNTADYERGWKHGYGEGYDKATKAAAQRQETRP